MIRVTQPFGPQNIYEAVEKIMKWRDSQIQPASPAPDGAFSLVSPQTQTESSPDYSGSDLYDRGTPADSNEAMSSPEGSAAPPPTIQQANTGSCAHRGR
ncbi:hypothetical protein PENFLA_c060G06441 [Penicillium flavigenum]|uniref:Uncharacterized protein n=1 Tax=Penicillium flavigenum TaxID=254877 RepID=A0A1V6SGM7_9EURO|nr:hypothetical protein PENFLA_c060G06441 [Penicillium flavigenum]